MPGLRYTDRLAEIGAAPSIGSVGDSYDNALAESTIGLYKPSSSAEAGRGAPPTRSSWRPLGYVDWFNHRRLHGTTGNVPPADAEAAHYAHQAASEMAVTQIERVSIRTRPLHSASSRCPRACGTGGGPSTAG